MTTTTPDACVWDVVPADWQPTTATGKRRVVVIDTETTGLDADTCRIVEIAAVEIRLDAGRPLGAAGGIVRSYTTLVNPGEPVQATEIHGITDDDVAAAPDFATVWRTLANFLAGSVVVGHHVEFDWRFLVAEAERVGAELPPVTLADTKGLAARHLPLPKHRLIHCCAHLGIDLRGAHSALDDTLACAELFAHLADYANPDLERALADRRFDQLMGGVVFSPSVTRTAPPPPDAELAAQA